MSSPLRDLTRSLGVELASLEQARSQAERKRAELAGAFSAEFSDDASLVVFGSLARSEWTQGSDLDWTLLVDGQCDPSHTQTSQSIRGRLDELGFIGPGGSGLFGGLAFSHEILHRIGGENDTNQNTTQRILLLSESEAFGKREAWDRVLRQIIHRYVSDDRGFRYGSGAHRVPRFLLNDVVRYWRTVTVDFAYKQRDQAGLKWALRHLKLSFSRKLIFAAGMMTCFLCDTPAVRQALEEGKLEAAEDRVRELVRLTPLERVALGLRHFRVDESVSSKLLKSYNVFLSTMNDPEKRGELERLTHDEVATSALFQELRPARHDFHDTLLDAFLGAPSELAQMTRHYGIF